MEKKGNKKSADVTNLNKGDSLNRPCWPKV